MIVVTGADGYLGWPLLLRLSKQFPAEEIVGVDHEGRRNWVREIGSVSAVPIASIEERQQAAHEHGMSNLSLIKSDLSNQENVYEMLKSLKPRVIVHAAAQPSAPYSHMNGKKANYTQENNNAMCRHLVWGLHELGYDHCHFITTTTTGVYGAPEMDIPEGFIQLDGWNNLKEKLPFPGMATSWYHMSKCNDINNLWLAHRLWRLPITDIRTAIVYGANTEETKLDSRMATRFDFDFYFGVLPNRFAAQALVGEPITIYGKGAQKKPMICLQDAVSSITRAVQNGAHPHFTVYNQFTSLVSPVMLATTLQRLLAKEGLALDIQHIANPRTEKEEHLMVMDNKRFIRDLLPGSVSDLETGMIDVWNTLKPYKQTILQYKDRFIVT